MTREIDRLGPEPAEPRYDTDRLARLSPSQRSKKEREMRVVRDDWLRSHSRWEMQKREVNYLQKLEVIVETPERTAVSSSVEALNELQIPPNLSRITVNTGMRGIGIGYDANVAFDLRHPEYSNYSITGRDAQIINGVAKTIDDKLGEHRTWYGFAHRSRYISIIAALFSVLIVWTICRTIMIMRGLQISTGILELGFFLFWIALLFVWFPTSGLLAWLFPFFTYEGDRQKRSRQAALGTILFVVGSLFVSLLYDLLRHLLSP